MAWVVDIRLHCISGLPTRDSTVEVRLRCGELEQSCATAFSYDGVSFLGAWTRIGVQEGSEDVAFEVLHSYERSWLMFGSRAKLAAATTLHLERDAEAGGGEWQEEELALQWRPHHKSDKLTEGVKKVVVEIDGATGKGQRAQGGPPDQQQQRRQQQAAGSPPGQPEKARQCEAPGPAEPDLEAALPAGKEGTHLQLQQAAGVAMAEGQQQEGPAAQGADGSQQAEAPDTTAAAPPAAAATGEATGDASEEEEEEGTGTLLLRLSYRLTPAAVALRQAPAAAAVPECGSEPVEMSCEPLPRLSHCYAHGGFMGASVSMMVDGRWRKILQREDPPSYERAFGLFSRLLEKDKRPSKRLTALMTCLENSPVLCAYGLVRSACTTPVVPLETLSRPASIPPGHESSEQALAAAAAGAAAAAAAAAAGDGKDATEAAGDGKDATEAAGDGKDATEAAGDGKDATEAAGDGKDAAEAGRDGKDAAAAGATDGVEAAATAVAALAAEAGGAEAAVVEAGAGGAEAAAAAAAAEAGGPEAAAEAEGTGGGEASPVHEEAAVAGPADGAATAQAVEVFPPPGAAPAPSPDQPPSQQTMFLGGVTQSELRGVFLTRSGRRTKRLEDYLASLKFPNRYGYQPIGLEWDLWIHPHKPAELQHATVDHGTQSQLVTQAITNALPCLKPLAKRAGQHQIREFGVSPVFWMNALGHSVNTAVNGDRDIPLPLQEGSEEQFYRLHVTVVRAEGGEVCRADLWDRVYIMGFIDSGSMVVPELRTRRVKPEGQCLWNHDMAFWPLPERLDKCDLVLEVRGDPAGLVRDRGLGLLRLPLRKLVKNNPILASGRHVELTLPIGARGRRRVHMEDVQATVAATRSMRRAEASTLHGKTEAAKTEMTAKANKALKRFVSIKSSSRPVRSAFWDDSDEEEEEGEERALEAILEGEAATAQAGGCGMLTIHLRLELVGVLQAAEGLGVTRAAAQTCLAMLSKPGGVYLDIKSAYSTPYDIQLFVSTLKGIGVHCKAVCSFSKHQLAVGTLVDTVLFFHGMSGLENACDNGAVDKGQFVLFNGASFLLDLKPVSIKALPAKKARAELGGTSDFPIDPFALRKYISLCETYGFAGGIYVQEPDASPASVSALARLVSNYPEYFPLGFAYGHLSGLGVSFLDQSGRGFAAQQILEEFQARKELSKKVIHRIKSGENRQATISTTIAWGQRLLYGSSVMGRSEQRTFIILLAQVWPHKFVAKVVNELGSIPRIFLRYFEHYELTTPLTVLEAGFNLNHTKDLIRLLRNRGVISGMSPKDKAELARFFCSRQLRGYGLTWVVMLVGVRRGLHKFAKEGLLCVLESCTQEEYNEVLAALGGRQRVVGRLRGRLHLSWHYTGRMSDIERLHKTQPEALAYQAMDMDPPLRYAALPTDSSRVDRTTGHSADPCHTRDKSEQEQLWRFVRKLSCFGYTSAYVLILSVATCCTFTCCCVGPRVVGSAARSYLGVSALFVFLLIVAIVAILAILLS